MSPKWSRIGVRPADVAKAITLHRSGQFEAAERAYRNILALDRNHVTALHFLGVLQHQTGDSVQAVATLQRAIALDPSYVDAHNNLGNIFLETIQPDAAFASYQRVVALAPNHANGWNNLGVLLRGRGQYDEADAAYARALQLNPSHAAAWQNRSSLQARLDQVDAAVAGYRRVLELQPLDTQAYDSLCRTLYRAGRVADAIAVYHEWLASDPGNAVAQHMLAAATGESAPARASDHYVRDTFDAFAGSFEHVLEQLGYQAPSLIGAVLDRLLPGAADGALAIADAGCGTGLCAKFLRPRAKRLVGVDLSPGMLSKARARRLYDELVEAELTEWLKSQRQQFDLIISADTLCYFGALDEPLLAAAGALRAGGRLAFTVETVAGSIEEYRLDPSGRYNHSVAHVRRALTTARLSAIEIEDVVLRRERGSEVQGLLVSARREPA